MSEIRVWKIVTLRMVTTSEQERDKWIAAGHEVVEFVSIDRIAQLEARNSCLEAARIAYASEFPLNSEGEPDVGSIHQNIRKLKADYAQLEADIAEAQEQIERKNVYLEATLQLFKKVDQSPYVIPVLYELAHYDEADCDGFCLANEIAIDLGFDEFRGYKEQQ